MATATLPARRPLERHLGRIAVAGAIVAALIGLVVSALAASRATAHVLSASGLAAFVGGAAAALVFVGWPNGLYSGAADVLSGEAERAYAIRPYEGQALQPNLRRPCYGRR